ncbi:sensor histidine kinase [Paenibacillus sp.]|jgi:signal transduction histidine kinase|uniref:sensor histidine kinase n=1 Tax=Paenibacillus sp. TaxID=58172 RepID=UPI002834A1BD|nr:sensor histidine kinase [Paenibacillus sp.]MDR0271248.1 sensor histidine kinase [Paenibacillus sp.]
MKLFWKDQIPLLVCYLVQMLLIPLLYWLSAEHRPLRIIAYGVLLSSIILAIYLVIRFIQFRKLYARLNNIGSISPEMELPLEPLGSAPLPASIQELLCAYDRSYQDKLNLHVTRMDRHITFINRWVHQMKTPLSVMQLTLRDIDQSAAADSIQEEIERLRKGLEMILYTSRLDQFEEDFRIEHIPLLQAVKGAVTENRRLFIRRSIQPDIRIGEEIAVYSDAKWLQFMLNQILINAINYSAGKGQAISITAEVSDKQVILDIQDQGIGISKEDLKRVFQPYFTGERGRQYQESTGMGLYLVREICSRLEHKVKIESEQGRGTLVRFIFQHNPARSVC